MKQIGLTTQSNSAIQRITAFRQRFGEGHFYLACHAALPLALTSDLLYCLWAEFQRDIHGNILDIPWIAVTDLLFSRLCEEVGYDLYEMEGAIQVELMRQLQTHSDLGQERVRELAGFVRVYMGQQLDALDVDMQDFVKIQNYRALAYTQPAEAAHSIAIALSQLRPEDTTEWIRMATLLETLAKPLSKYGDLVTYGTAMADFCRSNESEATAKFRRVVDKANQLQVAGVTLQAPIKRVPSALLERFLPRSLSQQRFQKWAMRKLTVLSVGIVSLVSFAFALYQLQQQHQRVEQLAASAEALLVTQPLNAQINYVATINAIAAVGLSQSALVHLPNNPASSAYRSLLHSIQVNQGRNLLFPGIISVAFSPDGKTIASGGADHKVRLWNATMLQQISKPFGKLSEWHQKAVLAVAFSPDGKRLVSSSVDRTIRVWDTGTGKPIGKPLIGHRYSVVSVAFSPDGKQIVSGSDDKTIRLWDAATGRQLMQMKGDPFQPILVGFSPDGQTIVGRSHNNIVRLWDSGTGEMISQQNGGEVQSSSTVFSADGKTIVSNNYNDLIRSLISPDRLLQTACYQLHDSLSLREPKTNVAQVAKQTCESYSRNESQTIAPQP